jgi:hypothetical protein
LHFTHWRSPDASVDEAADSRLQSRASKQTPAMTVYIFHSFALSQLQPTLPIVASHTHHIKPTQPDQTTTATHTSPPPHHPRCVTKPGSPTRAAARSREPSSVIHEYERKLLTDSIHSRRCLVNNSIRSPQVVRDQTLAACMSHSAFRVPPCQNAQISFGKDRMHHQLHNASISIS